MYKGHESIKDIYDLSRKFIAEKELAIGLLVDFGARHGESYEFLREFCHGDYVFVEPAPRAAAVVSGLVESINSIVEDPSTPRSHLIPAILGKSVGSIDMHTFEGDDDQSSNVFSDRGGRYGKTEIVSVPIVPYEILDEMFPGQRIDFAKINIEGGEYQLIEDGFFHKKIDAFVMELHNEHVKDRTWKNAVECLQDGFDIVTHGDLGYKYCFMSGVRCG